jgi:hypothetical protein
MAAGRMGDGTQIALLRCANSAVCGNCLNDRCQGYSGWRVGIGVAAEVVVGRRVLVTVLATQHMRAGLASGWPNFALLAAITAILGMAGVVLREQQRMLSELTSRYAQDRMRVADGRR